MSEVANKTPSASAVAPPTRESPTTIASPGLVSIHVAVVTYNSAREIADCLSSIETHCPAGVDMTVSVVDNASTDGTYGLVVNDFPWVAAQRSATNDGFAASTNRSLVGTTSDYVLLLNPDTRLRHGVLERLLETLAAEPRIGVIGCRLERADGSFDHACKRTFPSPSTAVWYFIQKGLHRRVTSDYLAGHVGERSVGVVDALNGAFMLVRRVALDQVGLLDDGYWMYGEDLDWCRRFRLAGWDVYYDGTVTATHFKGASSGRHRSFKVNWHFHRSMWRFYRKFDDSRSVVMNAIVYAGITLRFACSAFASVVGTTLRRRLTSPERVGQ